MNWFESDSKIMNENLNTRRKTYQIIKNAGHTLGKNSNDYDYIIIYGKNTRSAQTKLHMCIKRGKRKIMHV